MAKEKIKTVYEPFKSGLICIDCYDGRSLCGRLWYPHFKEAQVFENLMQFILLMESALKSLGFPMAYDDMRSFQKTASYSDNVLDIPNAENEPEPGTLATFKIKVIFQQNASWQGVVTWLEGKKEESFRSALELFALMDSALCGK